MIFKGTEIFSVPFLQHFRLFLYSYIQRTDFERRDFMIDAIAFKELYKTVYQDLYRFALCMMHHPQDAEDAVSEAVLSVL